MVANDLNCFIQECSLVMLGEHRSKQEVHVQFSLLLRQGIHRDEHKKMHDWRCEGTPEEHLNREWVVPHKRVRNNPFLFVPL